MLVELDCATSCNPTTVAFLCAQLARAYFALLEVLCHNHTMVVVHLDTPTFRHIVGSLETGLKCLDVSISSQVLRP